MTQIPTSEETQEPHKPADDQEEVFFEGAPKLRGELGSLILWGLIGLVLIALPILARTRFSEDWIPWWAVLASVVIGGILVMVPLIKIKAIRYRITNYRIDVEHGLLSKDIDTVELWHVEDVHFHQSLLNRIVGVGTITVISHDDTTPQIILKNLPRPKPLFESLKQRIIAVKRQRGVIKMDTGN